MFNICSECNQIYKKKEYGSCVILCKQDIRLCINCYFIFKDFQKLIKNIEINWQKIKF